MFSLPSYAMLNFRKQSTPKFSSTQRQNKVTGKQESFYDIQNDGGYTFKMVTPPCNALFPHLSEGGNFGGKYSQTKESSNIVTNLLLEGVDVQFKSEREDYFAFLSTFNANVLEQMYAQDAGGVATAIRAKTQKRYGANKTADELEAMALKAFKSKAMTPLKSSKTGEIFQVIKCKAYNKDLSPRGVRYVQPSGGQYVEMTDIPEIRNGALLSVPFMVRPYIMSKEKYGLSYTMIPDIVVYSTGTGRATASMADIETVGRPYTFALSESRDGKSYLNINDAASCNYEVRSPPVEVVFSDLTGDGTMGRIPGVTESSAKYTALCKEDLSNPDSVAFFDLVSQMQAGIVDFALGDDKLLTKLKSDSKEEAEEMASETGTSYASAFRTVVMDAFHGAVYKREEDEGRQLRMSQNVFSKSGAKNTLAVQDSAGNAIVIQSVQRGARIAPVLRPSVYFMADGKFGVKMSISLEHGYRLVSNPDAQVEGASGVLYELEERPAKRVKTDE